MPRERRDIPEHTVVHVICRFVNGEFRITDWTDRERYLEPLGRFLKRSDWKLVHYCVMSSHIHLVFLTGRAPLARIFQPLNTAVALHLNRRQGRSGSVFASRPTVIVVEGEDAAGLLVYVSNNPVRAGVAATAADSLWSSHHCYLDPTRAPEWLHVELGLELAGFARSAKGRAAFDELARERAGQPRDPWLSGRAHARERAERRAGLGAPVEVATARLRTASGTTTLEMPTVIRPHTPLRPRATLEPPEVLQQVEAVTNVPVASMRSRSRTSAASDARRLALMVWTRWLNRPAVEMAAALGISQASASGLLHRDPARCLRLVERANLVFEALSPTMYAAA